MTISPVAIKSLWGRGAGICAFPGCGADCLPLLSGDVAVLGEMAHIIAKEGGGPRGTGDRGSDEYENLILLCPTHHTLVDKEPNSYPVESLKTFKADHEEQVRRSWSFSPPENRKALFDAVSTLLAENYQLWKTWGPESDEARRNPGSSAAELWALRKLDRVVPNNKKIERLLRSASTFLTSKELELTFQFVAHAEAFEANCYEPREGAPRFPQGFREMIDGGRAVE